MKFCMSINTTVSKILVHPVSITLYFMKYINYYQDYENVIISQ
jgi:hypothetical protein